MRSNLAVLLCFFFIVDGNHFNGGTISWAPINPYNNSTSVSITITQSYSWAYPYISCANNVPISTSTFSGANRNLTCVVDCSTDGGYSTHPVDILTDCTSASTSLNKLSSTKSKNITLNAGAHFYLAYLGTAWVALNYPPQSGLEWSIVTFIDLRMRPDGFINTPPVASVVSPQYAFVNQTIHIQIPVSDANVGDDVRCRWSTYTTGYRRRKRYNMEAHTIHQSIGQHYESISANREGLAGRKKRGGCSGCGGCDSACAQYCKCCCYGCDASVCTGASCSLSGGCGSGAVTNSSTTTKSTTSTTTTQATTSTSVTKTKTTTSTTTDTTTTVVVTTTETLGTLKSTSSYPVRQAINECGGICYPGSLPSGTTLSNCTITFTGLRAGVWYAVAVQVEDFLDSASNIALSSVPVQFLIYVMPQPACPKAPIILPVNGCLEVQVGVSVSFRLYALNLCNRTIANLTDIILSSGITGMSASNLVTLSTNSSISYITFTWIPQASQAGFQEVCAVAFTSEKLRSNESCEIFTVKNSSDLCVTTTTTSTSTTTQSTSSTSATTTTTSTTSTSETTTKTITSALAASTTTLKTISSTSNSNTSSLISASAAATVEDPKKPINWLLILGLSLIALLLAICCSCCCLYWLLWVPAARRRRKRTDSRDNQTIVQRQRPDMVQKRQVTARIYPSSSLSNGPLINNRSCISTSVMTHFPSNMRLNVSNPGTVMTDVYDNRVSSTVFVRKVKRSDFESMNNIRKGNEMEGKDMRSVNERNNNGGSFASHRLAVTVLHKKRSTNTTAIAKRSSSVYPLQTRSSVPSKPTRVYTTGVSRNSTIINQQSRAGSADDISIISPDRMSIQMRPTGNRSKAPIFTTNDRASKGNEMPVVEP